MTKRNGFATKDDLKQLGKNIDKRFAQVDKKLGSIDIRLGVFKLNWDTWKQDAFTEFNSRWVNRIDPILAEIEKHREKEVIWAEQNRRTDKRIIQFQERLDAVSRWVEERRKQEPVIVEQNRRTQLILERIAKKVGVETE